MIDSENPLVLITINSLIDSIIMTLIEKWQITYKYYGSTLKLTS